MSSNKSSPKITPALPLVDIFPGQHTRSRSSSTSSNPGMMNPPPQPNSGQQMNTTTATDMTTLRNVADSTVMASLAVKGFDVPQMGFQDTSAIVSKATVAKDVKRSYMTDNLMTASQSWQPPKTGENQTTKRLGPPVDLNAYFKIPHVQPLDSTAASMMQRTSHPTSRKPYEMSLPMSRSTSNASSSGKPVILPALPPMVMFSRSRSASTSSNVSNAVSINSTDSLLSGSERKRRRRPRNRSVSEASDTSRTSGNLSENENEGFPFGGLSMASSQADSPAKEDELGKEVIPEESLPKRLTRIATRKELQAAIELIDIYTVVIPSKNANEILNILRIEFPPGKSEVDLQHLRRLVRPENMPSRVTGRPLVSQGSSSKSSESSRNYSSSGSGSVSRTSSLVSKVGGIVPPVLKRRRRKKSNAKGNNPLYLLLCATSQISLPNLYDLLSVHPIFSPEIRSTMPLITIQQVPLHPPSSQEQSTALTTLYWPTVYRRGNPFGPHPIVVEKVEIQLMAEYTQDKVKNSGLGLVTNPTFKTTIAEHYINLARTCADEGVATGTGLRIGAIVVCVDDASPEGRVISVACDARNTGNPLAHAAMRAIAFVGRKRVEISGREPFIFPFDINTPVTPMEQKYYNEHAVHKDGYLMHNLHVYLTHEPCVMCSMALLHSRIGLCIFDKGMMCTGGLHSDLASKVHVEPMSDEEPLEEYFDANEFLPYATSSPVSRASSRSSRYEDAREKPRKDSITKIESDLSSFHISLKSDKFSPHTREIFDQTDDDVEEEYYQSFESLGNTNFKPEMSSTHHEKPARKTSHASVNPHSVPIFEPSKAGDEDYLGGNLFSPDDENDEEGHNYLSNTEIIDYQRGRSRIPVHAPGKRDGYGLFWREKLNWKFLAFQWHDDETMDQIKIWNDDVEENVNA